MTGPSDEGLGADPGPRRHVLVRWWSRVLAGLTAPEMKERLAQVERGLELTFLDARQVEVGLKEAQAVKELVASLADIPSACVRLSAVLLVKYPSPSGPVIQYRVLNQREMKALDRYPALTSQPERVLENLALMAADDATDPSSER